uniref:Uncharacterized protein n=1 Tax=Denticeps clupeoides TaxID=299321 RepID=A0AAY4EWG7_9TELE
MSQLDRFSDDLLKVFSKKDGIIRKRIQDDSEESTEADIKKTTLGIYVIKHESADATEDPEDVGIVLEGVEVLSGLGNVALATAMLVGLIYSLNLTYPQELRYSFEVLQKIILELDSKKLSNKAQSLKTKLFT